MSTTTDLARPSTRTPTWLVGLGLALLALVVRLPTFFSPRHVGFDDGVYGASVLMMREGARPYHEVFSPQGPLHYPILFVGDLLGFRTLDSPRVASVVAGIVVTLAVWAAGRRIGTPYGAVLAGGLAATTGTMLWTTGPITGDGIAVAFASTAIYAALVYRDGPTAWKAVAVGLATGAALLVKVLVFPFALPVAFWLWSSRRVRDFAIAVGSAVVLGVVATVPWGFGPVYEQSVAYHQRSGRLYSMGEQASKLVTTLLSRDLPLLVAIVLGVIAAVVMHGRGMDRDTIAILVWLGTATVVLIAEPAMFRNHLSGLIPPLALLVAMRPPPLKWAAIAAIFCIPWWAVHLGDVLIPRDYRGDEAALVHELRALPSGAKVITDEPGFAWRAGRLLPDNLNDASIKRIDQGLVTTEVIADAAQEHDVCAVAIWSNRYGSELPDLPAALEDAGFEQTRTFAHDRSLWTKPACEA
jgi:hypothetical protein